MYKLETVNNSNFDFINEFNIASEFKEELLEICTNKNIFKKLLLGKNIKFIKSGNNYIGFMWFSKIHHQCYKIHCMKITPEYNTNSYYKDFFRLLNIYSSIVIGDNNNLNKDLLLDLGFKVMKTIIEMKKDILPSNFNKIINMEINNEIGPVISFRVFVNGIDEKRRCDIQNEVFNSLNRQAIDEDDIKYEKCQKHYIPEGCIFLSKNGLDIGYGQLIKREGKIYIANFGILTSYRGRGYGKLLLAHLIKVAESFNVNEIYLRCDEDNKDAVRLYKSQNFKIIGAYHEYEKNNINT